HLIDVIGRLGFSENLGTAAIFVFAQKDLHRGKGAQFTDQPWSPGPVRADVDKHGRSPCLNKLSRALGSRRPRRVDVRQGQCDGLLPQEPLSQRTMLPGQMPQNRHAGAALRGSPCHNLMLRCCRKSKLGGHYPGDFKMSVLAGTIHIVDDDASFRTALERRLRKAGYEVATYPSAQQLLDRLPNEGELGCILLDVRIPGLSGPQLQTRLIERGSTMPIIFLTGYADVPTTVKTIKAGAEDFLTKPVTSVQLLGAITKAISRHEMSQGTRQRFNAFRAQL